ncbi:protein LIKE EARLY STARVATION, chloroplastic [Lycium ferocissimum]|uniref:protein LIKE EARLY STARVATION, chloroplastic n=1 Tax=Lycium ferocissimum TaxID=112874 RepID=UPI00281697C4|nr:protein LIKE EARLY STARVATION, chloroplastic [Lycium ferocissimum]
MATHFSRATTRASMPVPQEPKLEYPFSLSTRKLQNQWKNKSSSRIKVSSDNGNDSSYLDMWKKAVERERKTNEFQRIAENISADVDQVEESSEVLEKKSDEFKKILEVDPEERDRIQRMQVIDRAAAALAAAKALLKENPVSQEDDSSVKLDAHDENKQEGPGNVISIMPRSGTIMGTPGPSFWSWTPPSDSSFDDIQMKSDTSLSSDPPNPVIEIERSPDFLSIPFQSAMVDSKHSPPLPPLQSHLEVENLEDSSATSEIPHQEEERELGILFSTNAAEAAYALKQENEVSSEGIKPDGSRWWKETGTEKRPDGVVCKWTLMRGVSADKTVEWEDKYWEAADEFGHKELGSEKSGRDAAGNVWHEFWKESMWQSGGLVHMEKTADKWGRNIKGEEWQEKWWEHYGAGGQAEKWAHKWCSIDPNTPLDAGHAHVWHERWGEKYDGKGGSTKYTDKWAERFEGDGWAKWGDKWDENFDLNGHGVKQGETWWAGKYGDRWNRTWGEGHNGSGWVHKYGKSSNGEHWDTHINEETWYERYPHYGFYHCFENSVQLREVERPSEWP